MSVEYIIPMLISLSRTSFAMSHRQHQQNALIDLINLLRIIGVINDCGQIKIQLAR